MTFANIHLYKIVLKCTLSNQVHMSTAAYMTYRPCEKHPVTHWCDRILAPSFSISVVKNLIKTIQKLIWWNSTIKRFKMSPPNAWFSRFFKKNVCKRKLISSNRKCSKSFITSHILSQKYYKDGQKNSHFNFLAFFYKLLLNISYVF